MPDDRVDPMAARPTVTRRRLLIAAGGLALAGTGLTQPQVAQSAVRRLPSRAAILKAFLGHRPTKFGMFLPGMVRHGKHGVALTFDACGGPRGSGYDEKLIETLRAHEVAATLFLNARWIEANPGVAAELAADPLFEIGNHGRHHKPLTVAGQSAYGIEGSRSVGGAYDEIRHGLDAVAALTGARPRWFRPGTAWADDVGVAIAHRMGLRVISFSINADAGATASKAEVAANLSKARSKAITIGHFNHPEGKTAEGLAMALPKLIDRGTSFRTLSHALEPTRP